MNYAFYLSRLQGRCFDRRRVMRNTWLKRDPEHNGTDGSPATIVVQHWSTDILKLYSDGSVSFNFAHAHDTVTTRTRLDEFLPSDFRVFAYLGVTYIKTAGVGTVPVEDDVCWYPNRGREDFPEEINRVDAPTLRKQSYTWAVNYVRKLVTGQLDGTPACTGCYDRSGKRPDISVHVLRHVQNNEYPLELIHRAVSNWHLVELISKCTKEERKKHKDWLKKMGSKNQDDVLARTEYVLEHGERPRLETPYDHRKELTKDLWKYVLGEIYAC
jgi:hypothetical protein